MFVGYFSHLPLFIIGLGFGVYPIIIAGGVAVLAVSVGIGVAGGPVLQTGLSFFLLNTLPVVFLVRQALLNRSESSKQVAWYPSGYLLAWLAVFAIILQLVMKVFSADFDITGLNNADSIAGALNNLANSSPETRKIAAILKTLLPYMPGIMTASWMLMVIINAAIGQSVLRIMDRNIRQVAWTDNIELPNFLLLTLAVSGVLAISLGGHPVGILASNIAIILAIPFLLKGLATVHLLCAKHQYGALMLGPFYIFVIFFPWTILFITILGIFEPWLKLSARFTKADKK